MEASYKLGTGSILAELGVLAIKGEDARYFNTVTVNRKLEGMHFRLGYRYPVAKMLDLQGGLTLEDFTTTQKMTGTINRTLEATKKAPSWWVGVHSRVAKHMSLELNVGALGFYSFPVKSATAVGEKEALHGLAATLSVGFTF